MMEKVVMNQKVFRVVSEKLKQALEERSVTSEVTPDTPIFGRHSPLDSVQLVSLIVDIEEGIFAEFGREISLADEQAMSQKHSPFRNVASMCAYIETVLSE
jgi:acyl carrier protein